jgi:glycosyltransferase involved in cell wall biosynthesis
MHADIEREAGHRMTLPEPLVSVTILAYNHGKYVKQAVQSVLDQTHKDLEVVVINDGSIDNTCEVLRTITDPRVRVFHQTNLGPSVAANRALAECRGKYIAIMAADDLLPPQRIERQLAEYVKGPSRVLFSQVEFMDEDGKPVDTDRYRSNLTPAYGKAKVLRRLFEGGAPAFILTMFTEARILKGEEIYCEPALYQLQDYELMIRLAKKYDFDYLDEKLYRFRMRRGELNLSGHSPEKHIRTRNEFNIIMRRFFDGISPEFFKEIFPDLVKKPDFTTTLEYLCEQAFVLLQAPTGSLRLLGLARLYDLLHDPHAKVVLEREYGFTHVTFAAALQTMDNERMYQRTCLYLDSGKGLSEAETVRMPIDPQSATFRIRFPVSPTVPLRMVRWDPVEGFCRVWLESVAFEDTRGQMIPLSWDKITTNGALLSDGSHLFGTQDPMFYLPVDRNISAVVIQGRWSFGPPERPERFRTATLFVDRGTGFHKDNSVTQQVYVDGGQFTLVFNATYLGAARAVAFQPLSGCGCKVLLQSVMYQDAAGVRHSVDLDEVTSNGRRLRGGMHLFETHDPLFVFPITGEVTQFLIRGWWSCLPSQAELDGEKRLAGPPGLSRWVRRVLRGGVRRLQTIKQRILGL